MPCLHGRSAGLASLVFLVFLILVLTDEGLRYVLEAKCVLPTRRRTSFQAFQTSRGGSCQLLGKVKSDLGNVDER
jgi:hypothetical protein